MPPSSPSNNRVCRLLGTRYPIVAGGMAYCSGWRLAAAVSGAGGLGLLGAGTMTPAMLSQQILKCRAALADASGDITSSLSSSSLSSSSLSTSTAATAATDRVLSINNSGGVGDDSTALSSLPLPPIGVNLPLHHPAAPQFIDVIISHRIPVVFTSAGSPKTWTKTLKDRGITVVHVVPSSKLALKCQEAGVDAVVAEGFEAGGHNGVEEITTLTLIPQVRAALSPDMPLIAAGGVASGQAMLACMALGAEGVQVGTRFMVSEESSCDARVKDACVAAREGDTWLTAKRLSPTRMLRNAFCRRIEAAEADGTSREVIKAMVAGLPPPASVGAVGTGAAAAGRKEGLNDDEEGKASNESVGATSTITAAASPTADHDTGTNSQNNNRHHRHHQGNSKDNDSSETKENISKEKSKQRQHHVEGFVSPLRRGMLGGDVTEGQIDAGEVVAACGDVPPAAVVVARMVEEYEAARQRIAGLAL